MTSYKVGSSGRMVEAIQEVLNASVKKDLPRLEIDGKYGPKTKEMVEAFQSEHKPLAVDGIVGPNTMRELERANLFLKEKALRELPVPDVTVGQQENSHDCGYFAAYVLARYATNSASLGGLTFSRSDVFQMRDKFSEIDPEYRGKEQTHTKGNYLKSMKVPDFLAQMGAPGYRFDLATGRGPDGQRCRSVPARVDVDDAGRATLVG